MNNTWGPAGAYKPPQNFVNTPSSQGVGNSQFHNNAGNVSFNAGQGLYQAGRPQGAGAVGRNNVTNYNFNLRDVVEKNFSIDEALKKKVEVYTNKDPNFQQHLKEFIASRPVESVNKKNVRLVEHKKNKKNFLEKIYDLFLGPKTDNVNSVNNGSPQKAATQVYNNNSANLRNVATLNHAQQGSVNNYTQSSVDNTINDGDQVISQFYQDSKELLGNEFISVQDKIAPISLEVDFNDLKINDTYVRVICIVDYKKAFPGLFDSLINYDEPISISMYYYPINTADIMEKIRRKIADIEAQLNMELEQGKVPNAYLKVALQDALLQQEELASGVEKYFHFAVYIVVRSSNLSDLNNLTAKIFSDLRSKEMSYKLPTLRMEQAFKSALPYGFDQLKITRNMDTTSIAMTFPFTSSDLSQDKGVLYGINTYNNGLIIFDRFSMPNANMVVFATSGGGKSYFVKLEILRSLMLGTECIVIDPENEYEQLAKTVGGAYISFSQDGKHKLNPFELPAGADTNEDELRLKELSLQGFFKILFGSLSNRDVNILDKAIRMAYREKGITNDKSTFVNEPPRMEDLYKTLRAMEEFEAQEMAMKLERFLIGAAAGIFDKKTNIDINSQLTVFSIRELSEELRPLAMYLMLDFIWTKVKRQRKRRILAIDEAWLLMKYPDSALFINSVAKRARKYYLGLTTITQDVSDFLSTDYGRAIVTNSSIQVLFRQNQVAVDALSRVYNLSEGEKAYLMNVPPGQGLFFAGNNHVSINVKASPWEHAIVTSNPVELEKMQKEQASLN